MSQVSQSEGQVPELVSAGLAAVSPPKIQCNPERAANWFRFARRSGNPVEGAITYWLSGLKEDPSDLQAIKDYLSFMDPLKGSIPQLAKLERSLPLSGGVAESFITALFRSGAKPSDSVLAGKTVECAVGAGLIAVAEHLAGRAMEIAKNSTEKPAVKRDAYYALALSLSKAELYQSASLAAKAAKNLFPMDQRLIELDKNLAAQAYTQKTKLDKGVTEGTFLNNILDPEKQRRLEEGDRLVISEGSLLERIEAAKVRYEAEPANTSAVTEYCKLLVRSGDASHEDLAILVLETSATRCQSKLFRQQAADLRMRKMERELDAFSSVEGTQSEVFQTKRNLYWSYRKEEFERRLREEATNSEWRFQFGRALYHLDHHLESIEALQKLDCQKPTQVKANALIVESFVKLSYYKESLHALMEGPAMKDGDRAAQIALLRGLGSKVLAAWESEPAESAKEVLRTIAAEILTRDVTNVFARELRASLY